MAKGGSFLGTACADSLSSRSVVCNTWCARFAAIPYLVGWSVPEVGDALCGQVSRRAVMTSPPTSSRYNLDIERHKST
jgi:hypothetical protein